MRQKRFFLFGAEFDFSRKPWYINPTHHLFRRLTKFEIVLKTKLKIKRLTAFWIPAIDSSDITARHGESKSMHINSITRSQDYTYKVYISIIIRDSYKRKLSADDNRSTKLSKHIAAHSFMPTCDMSKFGYYVSLGTKPFQKMFSCELLGIHHRFRRGRLTDKINAAIIWDSELNDFPMQNQDDNQSLGLILVWFEADVRISVYTAINRIENHEKKRIPNHDGFSVPVTVKSTLLYRTHSTENVRIPNIIVLVCYSSNRILGD